MKRPPIKSKSLCNTGPFLPIKPHLLPQYPSHYDPVTFISFLFSSPNKMFLFTFCQSALVVAPALYTADSFLLSRSWFSCHFFREMFPKYAFFSYDISHFPTYFLYSTYNSLKWLQLFTYFVIVSSSQKA